MVRYEKVLGYLLIIKHYTFPIQTLDFVVSICLQVSVVHLACRIEIDGTPDSTWQYRAESMNVHALLCHAVISNS